MSYKKYRQFCMDNKNNDKCTPALRGLLKFSLRCEVSAECGKCSRLYLNGGECHGKASSVPCLIFQETKVVDFDDMALDATYAKAKKEVEQGGK